MRDPLGQAYGFFAAVGKAQHHQQPCVSHDPEPDAAGLAGHGIDLRKRMVVGINDVVQESNREADGLVETLPVELVLTMAWLDPKMFR